VAKAAVVTQERIHSAHRVSRILSPGCAARPTEERTCGSGRPADRQTDVRRRQDGHDPDRRSGDGGGLAPRRRSSDRCQSDGHHVL